MKHVLNMTMVEKYHIDPTARNAINRMQLSVSRTTYLLSK